MSSTEITVITKEELPSFIKKKHELQKVLDSISKGSSAAVKLLLDTITDEKVDIKLRVQCAKDLLTFHTSIADQISKDQMNRLIAEIKIANKGVTPSLTVGGKDDDEDDSTTPVLDFTTIREVD